MFRLEWTLNGKDDYTTLSTWNEVKSHAMYHHSTILKRMPIGWCVI